MSQSSVSVTLHRFYLNESKAVRFGTTDDSLLVLALAIMSYVVVYGLYITAMVVQHLKRHEDYYVVWRHHYGSIWDVLWSAPGNNTLVAILLLAWLSGYLFISWTVWHQFEQRENGGQMIVDDLVLLNHRDGSPVDIALHPTALSRQAEADDDLDDDAGDGDGDGEGTEDTRMEESREKAKLVSEASERVRLPVVPAALVHLPDSTFAAFYHLPSSITRH
jgi:hypothetical protein